MKILKLIILMTLITGCASYEYKPFKDSVDACFSKEVRGADLVLKKCYSQPAFVDLDKIHEMSPTEKRYLPSPSD